MPLPTCAPGNDVERLLFLKILATTSDPVTFNQSVSCSCEVRAHCGFGKCFLVLSKKKKKTHTFPSTHRYLGNLFLVESIYFI